MAEGKITLEVVTPERRLVSTQVDEVTAPGFNGEFGVLPRHTPYLCQLDIGVLSYRVGSGRYFLSIIDGYADVGPEKVTILAEMAEAPESIDAERAKAARGRAMERMRGEGAEDSPDFERAEISLKRALARLSVARQSGVDRDQP